MTQTAISREVRLDQLVLPPDDVRQGRDAEAVRSIASSMGDPDVGQQQPITTYPNDHAEAVETGDEDELGELHQDGHPLVIHDGVTRYRAAEMLGWETIWAVITPEPPEDDVIARLEANTERLDMSDFEVYSALRDYYLDSEASLADVGEKLGVSESYVSRVFSLFDAPDFILEAWSHPGHPLNTSHAIAVNQLLNSSSIQRYAEAGDLTEAEALDHAEDDARLMVDVQQQHDLQVKDFRQRCKRCQKETIDQLKDGRSQQEKQADGQTRAAERAHSTDTSPTVEPCLICGADRPHQRKFAVPVCEEDYGMLSDVEAQGETLLATSDSPQTTPEALEGDAAPATTAAHALAEAAEISLEDAQGVVDHVQQEAAQAQPEAGDD